MIKDFAISIGKTIRELKYLHCYVYGFLPMFLVSLILMIITIFTIPRMTSSGSIFGYYIFLFLVFLLLFYYVQLKIMQIVVFREMEENVKTKDTSTLKYLEQVMDKITNIKNFWIGFFEYFIFTLGYVVLILIIFGFSKLFHLPWLQSTVFYILLIIAYAYILYFNVRFFTVLDFFKSIKFKMDYKLWFVLGLIDLASVLLFLYIYKVFAFILPIYLAVLFPVLYYLFSFSFSKELKK